MSKNNNQTGRDARLLARRSGTAALGTVSRAIEGWPYTSLVLTATDHDGAPLLLISTLAEHTANIASDSRVSLLFSESVAVGEDPLTRSRVTVVGRASSTDADGHRARFLARHGSAAEYAGFSDFSVYRIEVERAHIVAGFGRIDWIEGSALIVAPDHAMLFAAAEPGIVDHMNTDHRDSVGLYATRLLGRSGGDWCLTGCDPDGLDLFEPGRREYARLDFDHLVAAPGDVRKVLVDLTRQAKAP